MFGNLFFSVSKWSLCKTDNIRIRHFVEIREAQEHSGKTNALRGLEVGPAIRCPDNSSEKIRPSKDGCSIGYEQERNVTSRIGVVQGGVVILIFRFEVGAVGDEEFCNFD